MSEITLAEILKNIIDNWKKSILIIFLTFLIGISFIFFRVDNYIYSLQIDELKESDFVNYNSFNFDFNILNNQLIKATALNDSIENNSLEDSKYKNQLFFDKNEMLNLFITDLVNRESMKIIMEKINLFDVSNFDTKDLYHEKLNDFVANDFNVEYPVLTIEDKNLTEEKFRKNHIISFTISEKSYNQKIFTKLIEKANQNVQEYFSQKYNEYILSQKRKIKYRIQDLENEINSLREEYKLKTESRLLYLQEQSEIAEVLEISDNKLFSDLFIQDNKNRKIELVSDNDPYYLRGYKAIKKEISLIKNRKTVDEYVYDISPLKVELSNLKNQKNLIRLNESYGETQVVKDKFKAIDYSLAEIKKKRVGISNFLILFLTLVVGLVLSLLNIMFIVLKKNFR